MNDSPKVFQPSRAEETSGFGVVRFHNLKIRDLALKSRCYIGWLEYKAKNISCKGTVRGRDLDKAA